MQLKLGSLSLDHPTILSCLQTNSTQYAQKRIFNKPKGVMIHCSERPVAQLKHYIQPSSKDEFRLDLIKIIGQNVKFNDGNHTIRYHGFHFVIGKNVEGNIISAQTMPTNMKVGPDKYLHILICRPKKVNQQYLNEIIKQIQDIGQVLSDNNVYNLSPDQFTIFQDDEGGFTDNNLTKEKILNIIK